MSRTDLAATLISLWRESLGAEHIEFQVRRSLGGAVARLDRALYERERHSHYNKAHPEWYRAKKARQRAKHPERARERLQRFYDNHPDYWRGRGSHNDPDYARRWREAHPDYDRERYQRQMADPDQREVLRAKWRRANERKMQSGYVRPSKADGATMAAHTENE